jgi:hypothetical protein
VSLSWNLALTTSAANDYFDQRNDSKLDEFT